MKEHIDRVELLNRTTGQFEPAGVYQELDDKNIRDFEQLWKPLLADPATPHS